MLFDIEFKGTKSEKDYMFRVISPYRNYDLKNKGVENNYARWERNSPVRDPLGSGRDFFLDALLLSESGEDFGDFFERSFDELNYGNKKQDNLVKVIAEPYLSLGQKYVPSSNSISKLKPELSEVAGGKGFIFQLTPVRGNLKNFNKCLSNVQIIDIQEDKFLLTYGLGMRISEKHPFSVYVNHNPK